MLFYLVMFKENEEKLRDINVSMINFEERG